MNGTRWVLLVEDDLIFSMLFCRFWKASYPGVEIQAASSLAAMRSLLKEAGTPPLLAILDRSLPDGDGHEAALGLSFPCHCWSALGEGGAESKPKGKPELETSVQQLGALVGL